MQLVMFLALILNPQVEEYVYEVQIEPRDSLVLTAKFMGYTLGDYYYAVFAYEDGNLFDASAPVKAGLDVFLFQHRNESMEITVVNISAYIQEIGEATDFPTVVDASTSDESYVVWHQSLTEKEGLVTPEDFWDRFGDPKVTEDLFDDIEYMNETGATYRSILQPEE